MSVENFVTDAFYIKKIQFTVFTNDAIKKYSVIKEGNGINISETYEKGIQKQGGLLDKRMGVTEHNLYCDTCHLRENDCPGHFGHIELMEPVFHYGFIDTIKGILSCVCINCCKLLIDSIPLPDMPILSTQKGKNQFEHLIMLSSLVKRCSFCNVPVPKISKNSRRMIIFQYNKKSVGTESKSEEGSEVSDASASTVFKKKIEEEINSPYRIYNILYNISKESYNMMGFNKDHYSLENLIIKNFPVPPPAVRPSIKLEMMSFIAYEDGLTKKLADIVNTNNILKKKSEGYKVMDINSTDYQKLQIDVAQFYDSETAGIGKVDDKIVGKGIRSISERLRGKEGRIRGNLMGKRVDYSARTVITSDPNLSIEDVGVPIKIATNLTFPEVVTPRNILGLTKIVRSGKANYIIPGKNIRLGDKGRIDLKYCKYERKLHYGDIVERHMMDGDPILFNRQPSLHKMSMMCHRVKIIKNPDYNTFRLNVTVTTPYNADFDGDEMNLLAPRSLVTQIELLNLASVKRYIISPKHSRPIITIKQDTLIGMYKMTRWAKTVLCKQAMNIISYCSDVFFHRPILSKTQTLSGHDLFSAILPKDLTIIDQGFETTKIEKGYMTSGVLKSALLNHKILNTIWYKNGEDVAQFFLDNCQRLVNAWLLEEGFTVGLGDAILAQDHIKKIEELIAKTELEAHYMITEIENNPELLDHTVFEELLKNFLKACEGDSWKIANDSLSADNNFLIMVNSKAKGGASNIGQIAGTLGQNILEFGRIPKTVNNRSTVHFFQNDDTPAARGFIKNSYYTGLTPQEFFFHHATGREGLIDTSIKTADSGYLQRKLIKGMEDIMVNYDGTVRNCSNKIIQFAYGSSALDQVRLKEVTLYCIKASHKEMYDRLLLKPEEMSSIRPKPSKATLRRLEKWVKEFMEDRTYLQDIHFKGRFDYNFVYDTFKTGVDIDFVLSEVEPDPVKTELEIDYVLDKLEYILSPKVTYVTPMNDDDVLKKQFDSCAKFILKMYLYESLGPKRSILQLKLTKGQFDGAVNQIISLYNKALVIPGEMVGILSAQSLGETLTQMTLNTFHKAGQGVKGMQGIPRVREIVSYSKNIKEPFMMLRIKKPYQEDYACAQNIVSDLQYTLFNDFVKSMQIIFYPNYELDPAYSTLNTKDVLFLYTSNKNISTMPWAFSFTLGRDKLYKYNISILDFKLRFYKFWVENMSDALGVKRKTVLLNIVNMAVLSNYDNSEGDPIVHILFDLANVNNSILMELFFIIQKKVVIKGVNTIRNVDEVNKKKKTYDVNYKTGDLESNMEYIVATDGIDLDRVKNNKYIEFSTLVLNDIQTVYANLGIEAARNLIVKEIDQLYNGSDNPINLTHIYLLADIITNVGNITSIDRYGINKLGNDPLAKASFEKMRDHLINAAVFNEVDYNRSVSSRVMTGRVIKGGTGLCSLLIDNHILENTEILESEAVDEETVLYSLEKNKVAYDILNRKVSDISDIYVPHDVDKLAK